MTLLLNNVILAEDDPEISSMVKDYFEQAYGLSVTTTDKVDEIIPLVLKTKASVLIMDLELKLTGLLRSMNRNPPPHPRVKSFRF